MKRASLRALGTAALLLALAAPAAAQGPCNGCVTDKLPHPMTALAKPALGQVAIDPQFGTKIRRITAVNVNEGENAIIKPMYSTMQAWNADESRMILWHRNVGHELYDGRTYAFIRNLNVGPTDIEQILWDPVDPDVFYYPTGYNAQPIFKRYRVSTNTDEVYHDFGNAPTSCPRGDWGRLLQLGRDPQYMSWGPSKLVALQCGEKKFTYDITARAVIGQRTYPGNNNTPIVGATGTLAFFVADVLDALSPTMATILTLPLNNGGGSPDSAQHSGLGKSAATGHDTYNFVAFDGGPGGDAATGTIVTWDLVTATRKVVVGPSVCTPGNPPVCYTYPPSGTHISAIAHKTAGSWVSASIVGDPGGGCPLCQEIILANTDTGVVYRVAHHRSWGPEGGNFGYWAEPHNVISPTGTRILFGSDWGNGPSVDSYVVELPGYTGQPPSPGPSPSVTPTPTPTPTPGPTPTPTPAPSPSPSVPPATTWSSPAALSNESYDQWHSSIAAAGNVVHWIHGDGDAPVYYRRSTDQGASWPTKVQIGTGAVYLEDPLATDGQSVHAAYVRDIRTVSDVIGPRPLGNVYYRRSTNSGTNWQPELRLTTGSNVLRLSMVAVQGRVHLTWMDFRSGVWDLWYRRSLDGGATWQPEVRLVAGTPGMGAQRPAMAGSGSNLVVSWMDGRGPLPACAYEGGTMAPCTEVYTLRSVDGGATWGSERRVTNDLAYSGRPEIVALSTGAFLLVWDQGPGGGGMDIFSSLSTDSGATWGAPKRATYGAYDESHGNLAAGPNGTAWMLFADLRGPGQAWVTSDVKAVSYQGGGWGLEEMVAPGAAATWAAATTTGYVHAAGSSARFSPQQHFYSRRALAGPSPGPTPSPSASPSPSPPPSQPPSPSPSPTPHPGTVCIEAASLNGCKVTPRSDGTYDLTGCRSGGWKVVPCAP